MVKKQNVNSSVCNIHVQISHFKTVFALIVKNGRANGRTDGRTDG